MSVVALGDKHFVTSLRATGVDGRAVVSPTEAEGVVDGLVSEGRCRVVIVAAGLAAGLERKRNELAKRGAYFPIFVVVPERPSDVKAGADRLYRLIGQAVGARLKLGED